MSVFLNEVHALNAAVPYELLYFYHSYKLEFTLLPASSRTMGKACKHKAVATTAGNAVEAAITSQGLTGICTFDEFVKHVLKATDVMRYTSGSTGLTIDPDNRVATNFPVKGVPIEYNVHRVVVNYRVGTTKPTVSMPGLFDLVADRVQSARVYTETSDPTLAKVPLMLTKATTYLKAVAALRINDQLKFKLGAFKAIPSSASWSNFIATPTKSVLGLDGKPIVTYNDLDVQLTIDNAGDEISDSTRTSIQNWSQNYPGPDVKAGKHLRIINAVNIANNRLSSAGFLC